jgi:hypothetical protein
MASIFDLWPASMWPGQPFIPPIDPAQPSTWPQSVGSSWDPPANYAASLDWPLAPAASQQPPPASQWNLLPPPPPGQPFAPLLPAPLWQGARDPLADNAVT